ncbi:MAG: hypothetical protein V3T70_04015, partial [Phycisphaerae bacterium]
MRHASRIRRNRSIVKVLCMTVLLWSAVDLAHVYSQSTEAPTSRALEDGKLYLSVGTVDTSRLDNLLRGDLAAFRPAKIFVVRLSGP